MPSAPTAYPLGPPTISGSTITVDELLNQPDRITRDIADLAMQRFYMDRVFTAGGGVNGGAVLFETPNPLATDLYGNRDTKEVAPGEEFPSQAFDRGVPIAGRPKKIGNKWFVTREAVKRNNPRTLQNNMKQTANTIRRRIENLGIAELTANVTNSTRFRTGTSWATFAGLTQVNRTSVTGPVADVTAAILQIDLEERGIDLDSMILHPNEAATAKQAYPGMSLKEIFSQAADPEDEGPSGINNIYVTPRYTAGRALLFESGAVGEWRNEFPLEEETEWEGVASGGRQRWWYQWSISPLFLVDNPYALLEIRGIA